MVADARARALTFAALSDAEQAVILTIIHGDQAFLPLCDFAETDAEPLAALQSSSPAWLELWERYTPDGVQVMPAVTLTPWAVERVQVWLREKRMVRTKVVPVERKVRVYEGLIRRDGFEVKTVRSLRLAHELVADDNPAWDSRRSAKPWQDVSVRAPRHGREKPMRYRALDETAYTTATRDGVAVNEIEICGMRYPVQVDRRL